jgi:hypothetical protein
VLDEFYRVAFRKRVYQAAEKASDVPGSIRLWTRSDSDTSREQSSFSAACYACVADLQADLDAGVKYYNGEREHQGRWCFGKTPMLTFLDAAPIARAKNDRRLIGDRNTEPDRHPDARWRPPITGVSDDFWPLCWRWRRVGVVEGA